jgi:hypothetical protein
MRLMPSCRVAAMLALALLSSSCASAGGAPAAGAAGAAPGEAAAATVSDQAGRRAPAYEQRFLTDTRPFPSGVRVRVTVFETPVAGATRQEFTTNLRAQQEAIQGRRDGAQRLLSSRWNMRWSWQTTTSGRAFCGFRTVTVFLDYQTHYVRLAGPIAEDPVAQEWWAEQSQRTYNRHLVHLRALRDAVGETQQKLRDLTAVNCETLTRDANAVANRDLYAIADRIGATVYSDPPASEP